MGTSFKFLGRWVIGIVSVALFLVGIIIINHLNQKEPRVLQADDVQVEALVGSCIVELTVYPEKRIPVAGNWGTDLTVDIYDAGDVYLDSYTTSSNALGVATEDVCAQGVYLSTGVYNFYIRGFSHLRKRYAGYNAFATPISNVDVTADGPMLAGETSVVYDNYINSLDISTQINALYSGSIKNDLNRDSKVNSLDLSNTITNFFTAGE